VEACAEEVVVMWLYGGSMCGGGGCGDVVVWRKHVWRRLCEESLCEGGCVDMALQSSPVEEACVETII